MANQFQKDIDKTIDRLWKPLPLWLKTVIIMAVIIVGIFTWTKLPMSPQNIPSTIPLPQNFSCRFYAEVLANVNELDKVLEEIGTPGFNLNKRKFIYDDYKKYDPSFGFNELDKQIKNFYINLQKLDGYMRGQITETRDQGKDILNKLEQNFGCRDYFQGALGDHAVSADTVTVVEPLVIDLGMYGRKKSTRVD